SCEHEVVKEEEVTGATAKLVWGCAVPASKAPQNEFGAGTSGLVLAPVSERRRGSSEGISIILKCSMIVGRPIIDPIGREGEFKYLKGKYARTYDGSSHIEVR
ncbi:MAG: hypothetical protein QGD90_11565, partial [Candidatus Hydrogenedentes bacterium]|nr:hypothetical protein [Candidatus Hydrogenedentota bacterium]